MHGCSAPAVGERASARGVDEGACWLATRQTGKEAGTAAPVRRGGRTWVGALEIEDASVDAGVRVLFQELEEELHRQLTGACLLAVQELLVRRQHHRAGWTIGTSAASPPRRAQ